MLARVAQSVKFTAVNTFRLNPEFLIEERFNMTEVNRTSPLEPVPNSTANKNSKQHTSVWPYILIIGGIAFLLDNLGLQNWGFLNSVVVWWPLILIVIGVEILTRAYPWSRMLTLGLLLLTFIAMMFSGMVLSPKMRNLTRETIQQPILAKRAEIQLGVSVGRLEIGQNNTGRLIDGFFDVRGNERLERENRMSGDVQFARLEVKSVGSIVNFPNLNTSASPTWNLGLSPSLPIVLRVNTGVGDSRLDLTELKITDLTVQTGVGQTTVLMPVAGRVTARIEGGVGDTTVNIPNGMEARVSVTTGIGSVEVGGNTYRRDGDVYTSPNFATAANRLELEVRGGIGRIRVNSGR